MAKEIKTSIRIQASPQKVWAILTNFESYPSWNPFIKSIVGPAIVGKKIKARIEPPNASGMSFTPTVLVFNTNQEFRWLGHLLIPGLFDGEHSFTLTDNGDGSTTLVQAETFKGILVPLFKSMLDVNTVEGFNLMNQKVKELAEQP
ncbi:MAG: polyketide cyclase [Bacteroidetes bacterium B1(2017)]|nr:MAG: polyketide cyclase [Bacteroidetes bacterium B1(2017)]